MDAILGILNRILELIDSLYSFITDYNKEPEPQNNNPEPKNIASM